VKKLTKIQLQFIDNYLIKNKVKYWDVRLELIDHIAALVEEKLTKGISFEDAMFEVHSGFGNNVNEPRLNQNNTAWITTKSLYENNKGFQELVNEKAASLKVKYSKIHRQEIKKIFLNPVFIILNILLIGFVYLFYNLLSFKYVYILNIIVAMVPVFYFLPKLVRKQAIKSQALKSLFSYYFLVVFSVLNFTINGLNFFDSFKEFYALKTSVVVFFFLLLSACSIIPVISKLLKEQDTYYKISIK
jgi:cation transport ATPase